MIVFNLKDLRPSVKYKKKVIKSNDQLIYNYFICKL